MCKSCVYGIRRNDKISNNKEVPHGTILERAHILAKDCKKYSVSIYGARGPKVAVNPSLKIMAASSKFCKNRRSVSL